MEMAGLVMGAQVMRSCMWGRGLLGSSSTSPACPERALYRSALLRLAHLGAVRRGQTGSRMAASRPIMTAGCMCSPWSRPHGTVKGCGLHGAALSAICASTMCSTCLPPGAETAGAGKPSSLLHDMRASVLRSLQQWLPEDDADMPSP